MAARDGIAQLRDAALVRLSKLNMPVVPVIRSITREPAAGVVTPAGAAKQVAVVPAAPRLEHPV